MLDKVVQDAHIRLLYSMVPMHYARATNKQVAIPLNCKDSADLFKYMDAHFYSWTGESLKTYAKNNS
jgi:hypothetical protein